VYYLFALPHHKVK